MEEAVTEQIIKSASQKVESNQIIQSNVLSSAAHPETAYMGSEKENMSPTDAMVNQHDMGVVNVLNYVKENQRNQNAEEVTTVVEKPEGVSTDPSHARN